MENEQNPQTPNANVPPVKPPLPPPPPPPPPSSNPPLKTLSDPPDDAGVDDLVMHEALKADAHENRLETALTNSTESFNLILFIVGFVVPFIAIGIYAYKIPEQLHITGMFSQLLLLSLASVLVGALFGFLFGIPKTLQSSKATDNTQYLVNTNLEQISDWLTKIFVGIGLIQLKNIPTYLSTLGATLQKNLGNGQLKDIGVVGVCIIIYFLFFGFLTLYTYTRINLADLFRQNTLDSEAVVNGIIANIQQDPELKAKLQKSLR